MTESETHQQPKEALTPCTEEQLIDLEECVGEKALKTIRDAVGNENITVHKNDGVPTYGIKYREKLLILTPLIINKEKKRATVDVSFAVYDHYVTSLQDGSNDSKKKSKKYTHVDKELQSGSLEFFRFFAQLAKDLPEDNQYLLVPISARRERLYRNLKKRYNLNNVIIVEGRGKDYDDINKSNTSKRVDWLGRLRRK